MQIKIKIIPDNGPAESFEFATYQEAIQFIIEKEPEDHEYIKVPSGSQTVEAVDRGWSIVSPEVKKINVDSHTPHELKVPIRKPGFLSRLLGK